MQIRYITNMYITTSTTVCLTTILILPLGSAADIVMMAMIKLWKSQVLKELGSFMCYDDDNDDDDHDDDVMVM